MSFMDRKNILSEGFFDSLKKFITRPKLSKEEKKLMKDLNASFGDVVIFHIHLKHRSGENISKKFRLTLCCRFHDTSKKLNIGKELYIYNKTKSPFLNKNLKYA